MRYRIRIKKNMTSLERREEELRKQIDIMLRDNNIVTVQVDNMLEIGKVQNYSKSVPLALTLEMKQSRKQEGQKRINA